MTSLILSLFVALPTVNDSLVIKDAWRPRDSIEQLTIEPGAAEQVRVPPFAHHTSIAPEPKETKTRFFYMTPYRTRGHWSGIHLGFTNFMAARWKEYRGDLSLDWANSLTLHLNMTDVAFLSNASGRALLLSGFGFEYNRLLFDRDVTVRVVDGQTITVPLADLNATNARRSAFKALYFTVPLIFELQTGPCRAHASAGLVAGARLHSKTKIVYDRAGDKKKIKETRSYGMNPFKVDLTARVGLYGLSLWVTKSLTPMFDTGKAPRVYPFTIGIGFPNF
ncbi:MAG: outer membrane beta-barrel protein [Odoribacteraceae bacterium]|nr:outer membrane beta-barrel protein [Odoribacteraceae bacterium]